MQQIASRDSNAPAVWACKLLINNNNQSSSLWNGKCTKASGRSITNLVTTHGDESHIFFQSRRLYREESILPDLPRLLVYKSLGTLLFRSARR
jgi:hypothetical protein